MNGQEHEKDTLRAKKVQEPEVNGSAAPHRQPKRTPMRLEAPVEVIDPSSNLKMLEVRMGHFGPELVLFQKNGRPGVVLSTQWDNYPMGGDVSIFTARGERAVSVAAHDHGGVVVTRGMGDDSPRVVLYADHDIATVELCLSDCEGTKIMVGDVSEGPVTP